MKANMIIFTRSVQHLNRTINLPSVPYIIKQFSDGELYVKILRQAQDDWDDEKDIWIITSTQPPAENILELFFLLDALTRSGAQKINIIFSYFGYARQAIAQAGEARGAQVITQFLQQFPLNKIYIIHAHAAPVIHDLLNFTNIIDFDFFCNTSKEYDVIAAPDKGAAEFAQQVAQRCNKEFIALEKTRPEHERVLIQTIHGSVQDKKVLLVDDIISTGSTMIAAANVLKKSGALQVSAAATHGIFSQGSQEKLQTSELTKIYVTNSVNPTAGGKIEVYDIGKFIEKVIKSS